MSGWGSGFFDNIKDTAKSLGEAAWAGPGIVWDVASAPFDGDKDTLSSLLGDAAHHAYAPVSLVVNAGQSGTSGALDVMKGLGWGFNNLVNRPLSAASIMASQHPNDLGYFTDSEDWARAWDLAKHQDVGQSFVEMLTNGSAKPFDTVDQTGQTPFMAHQAQRGGVGQFAAGATSFGVDFGLMMRYDPASKVLKEGGKLYDLRARGGLTAAQRADLTSLLTTRGTAQYGRVDRYLDWINGAGKDGRQLTAPEILYGTRALRENTSEGHVIAGLLADARKLDNGTGEGLALMRDTQRKILRVALGDVAAVDDLRAQTTLVNKYADVLTNLKKDNVLNLETLAATPIKSTSPEFARAVEAQLDNLDSAKDITRFVDDFSARIEQMVGKGGGDIGFSGQLTHVPGVSASGRRAVARMSGETIRGGVGTNLRVGVENINHTLDGWQAKTALKLDGASSLYQAGRYAMPLLVIKGMKGVVDYASIPMHVSDALRETHFTGVANLHDWGQATTQLDTMMKIANVGAGDRMKLLSEAFIAKNETEKLGIIQRIETQSLHSIAAKFASKPGAAVNKGVAAAAHTDEIDRSYIEALMAEHYTGVGQRLAQIRGRSYAATKLDSAGQSQMVARQEYLRLQSAGNAEDAANTAAARLGGKASVGDTASDAWNTSEKRGFTVDQIMDDSGVPVHLPLLETQLVNSVPLMDMTLVAQQLKRDQGYFARLGRAWRDNERELTRLSGLKAQGGVKVTQSLERLHGTQDWLVAAGTRAIRAWKFGVLFRLGYPMRVVMDDHMRIWGMIGAMADLRSSVEGSKNFAWNLIPRRQEAQAAWAGLRTERAEIAAQLNSDVAKSYDEIQAQMKTLRRTAGAHRGRVTTSEAALATGGEGVDTAFHTQHIAEQSGKAAAAEAELSRLQEELGSFDPTALRARLDQLDDLISQGPKVMMPPKRRIGQKTVRLSDGTEIPGSMADNGVMRAAASSGATFDVALHDTESAVRHLGDTGAYRTIQPTEPGHAEAWAHVLNTQVRNSPAAMHFVKGGDRASFARWVAEPEQADLRRRLPHYAHDADDWGGRIEQMLHDYIPSQRVADMIAEGKRISPRMLEKMYEPSLRPAVHGRALADNLGTSGPAQAIGSRLNRLYGALSTMPTDALSRHPFFDAMYRLHAQEHYDSLKAARGAGKWTEADLADVVTAARKLALNDVRRTLYDLSAHSHAAHLLRFVSPFFGAHQETLARWWRIIGDNPAVLRRFSQFFQMPQQLGLVVDKDGNVVGPNDPINLDNRLMLQVPQAWGGPDPSKKQAKWQIGLNAFNLQLQNGGLNPGVGPVVTMPMDFLARHYANEPELTAVAKLLNPYPSSSPVDGMIPAVAKRLAGVAYVATDHKVDPLGIGSREWNQRMGQNVADETTAWRLAHPGIEPDAAESERIMQRAGRRTNMDTMLRLTNNMVSPAAATPGSRYAAPLAGWRRLQEQSKTMFPNDRMAGLDWAIDQFQSQWGDAYLALIESDFANAAHMHGTPAEQIAITKNRPLLQRLDPSLQRMVTGAYADEITKQNEKLGVASPYTAQFLRGTEMQTGRSDRYWDTDSPAKAMEDGMANRGWRQYNQLTNALQVVAEQAGLTSYRQSPELMDKKRQIVAALGGDNWAWKKAYESFGATDADYAVKLQQMASIVNDKHLQSDPLRTDIQLLGNYLVVRDAISTVISARQAAGQGGYQSQANRPLLEQFAAYVDTLTQNTLFQTYMYDGVIEHDPYLKAVDDQ